MSLQTISGINLLYIDIPNESESDTGSDEQLFNERELIFSNTYFGKNAKTGTSVSFPNFNFDTDSLFSSGTHGNDSRIDPNVLNYLFKYVLNNIQYLQAGGAFFEYQDFIDYRPGSIVYLDNDLFKAVVSNGPNTTNGVVSPEDDTTGTWTPFIQSLIDQITSDEEIQYLKSQISALSNLTEQHESSIQNIKEDIRSINILNENTSSKLEETAVQANKNDLRIKELSNSVESLRSRVQTNERNINDIKQTINVINSKFETINVLLNTYENRIKNLEDYINNLNVESE